MKKLFVVCSAFLSLFVLSLSAQADFNAGHAAYKKGDYATAIKEWLPLAEKGDARSQFFIGSLSYHGFGVPQDYNKAEYWYRKAADQGNSSAQTSLGFMYLYGYGVDFDPKKAVYWWRKAAEQGSADAQHRMGVVYNQGSYMEKDIIKAYMWFSLAAEKKNGKSAVERDEVAKQMTPQQLAEARRLAREWKPKPAN
jgi:TPR repeat protein